MRNLPQLLYNTSINTKSLADINSGQYSENTALNKISGRLNGISKYVPNRVKGLIHYLEESGSDLYRGLDGPAILEGMKEITKEALGYFPPYRHYVNINAACHSEGLGRIEWIKRNPATTVTTITSALFETINLLYLIPLHIVMSNGHVDAALRDNPPHVPTMEGKGSFSLEPILGPATTLWNGALPGEKVANSRELQGNEPISVTISRPIITAGNFIGNIFGNTGKLLTIGILLGLLTVLPPTLLIYGGKRIDHYRNRKRMSE